MSRKHDQWLKARLESVALLAAKVYVTDVPRIDSVRPIPAPYVVLHPSDGVDESTRFTGPATTQHPRWVIHSVGTTTDQAKLFAEAVKGALVPAGRGVTPTIAGESPGRLWWSSPQPVQKDDDFTPPLHYHVAEVGFTSDLL